MGEGGPWVGSGGSESEEYSSLASTQVIYLFFQPMWTVPETMKSARVGGRAGHREDEQILQGENLGEGQSGWQSDHSPVPLTNVACTPAVEFCQSLGPE